MVDLFHSNAQDVWNVTSRSCRVLVLTLL